MCPELRPWPRHPPPLSLVPEGVDVPGGGEAGRPQHPLHTRDRERSQEHRWARSRLLFSRKEPSLHRRMAPALQPSERQHLGLSWVTRPAGASLPILAPRAQGGEGGRMVTPRPRCHLRASVLVGRPGRGVPPGGPNNQPRAVRRPAQLLDRWVPARPCSVLTLLSSDPRGGMQFRGLRSPWSLCELSSCQHRAPVPPLLCGGSRNASEAALPRSHPLHSFLLFPPSFIEM